MSSQETFEISIRWWSLGFQRENFEKDYQEERHSLKRITQQIRNFVGVAILTVAVLAILDILSAYVFKPSYNYKIYDVLAVVMYFPIMLAEYFCYVCPKFSFLRGSIVTVVLYFFLFFSTVLPHAEKLDYPAVSPTQGPNTNQRRILLWQGTMLFIHIFYVQSWLVSLVTYVVVYVEILGITFYAFGGKFANTNTWSAIADFAYYVIMFAAFTGFTVFAIRTYELRERASFFAELNTRFEMESWRALLDDLPEPVILAQNGSITFCNKATHKFLDENEAQFTEEEVMQQLSQVKRISGDRKSLSEIIKEKAIIPCNAANCYFSFSRGTKKCKLEVKGVEISQRNGATVVEYIIHDITTVEELEKEKVQNSCLQVLMATASHDIRTPVNAIQGAHDLLKERLDDPEDKECLKVAQVAVKRLLLYIRGLSYLKHIEAKNLQVNYTVFDAGSTVKEILDYFEPSITMKGLEIENKREGEIPQIVSDKDKYETIIYHILENAEKYTVVGKISISTSFDYEDNLLITQIKDTGTGIKPEQKKDFHKLFSKKHEKDEMNPQGIGLGLYLSYWLSKELGGDFTINNSENGGTTVTFCIKHAAFMPSPTEPPTETEVRQQYMDERREQYVVPSLETFLGKMPFWTGVVLEEEKRQPSVRSTERKLLEPHYEMPMPVTLKMPLYTCICNKVLLVDDSPMNLIALKGYLRSLNLKADIAYNGQQAIDCVINRRKSCNLCGGYSIIFMDINMPVMDGIEATERIVDLIKQKVIPNLHVVAVTAVAHLEDQEIYAAYARIGFTTIRIFFLCLPSQFIVQKPVSKKTFVDLLEGLFQQFSSICYYHQVIYFCCNAHQENLHFTPPKKSYKQISIYELSNNQLKMIYYGGIAKNKYVVADYTAFDGDFRTKFQQLVNAAKPDGGIKATKQESYVCYIKSNSDGYSFGCMVSSLVSSDVPNKFIDNLQRKVYQHLDYEVEGDSGSTAINLTKLIKEVIVFIVPIK
eukprot:TRINITY_DN2522_c0_g1_i1.p1 TRINITY_DN2522_c0_g1~~TRINITY_DN2522_c0_g1_i1.p1  ORF type:complete len:990 (-),score=81.73 TRINITY_DN2522_c0_g1_i1:555-3524(-)